MSRLSGNGVSESFEQTTVRRSFDVWNEVPLVAQTTGMSCWAAAAAMLIGWRERLAVDPDDVARGAGRWSEFKNGLHPEDVAAFAERWGLVAEQDDEVWKIDRFQELLETFGPLWVGEASPGLHAIVVTGLHGDGTPEATYVRVNDPWPVGTGERYTIAFQQLRTNFDAASRLTGDRAHILHSGGRGNRMADSWRSEQRFSRHVHRRERIGDTMNRYGRAALIDVESLEVRAGDRYIDTTRLSPDPLAGHGGSGENLYLAWNAIPDDATAIDVVVHLHGFSPLDPNRAMLERKVTASGLDLGGRTRPTLAILPRGRKITAAEFRAETQAGRKPNASRYTFPALIAQQGAGLERLIQSALAILGRDVLGGRTLAQARLIITVHSGAGQALEALVQHYTVRAACNPHEAHIFDALYAPSPNIAAWARNRVRADATLASAPNSETALARDGGGCRIIYGAGTQGHSMEVSRAFPTSGPLRSAYRAEATRVEHGDIPRVFGRALLTSVRADLVVVPTRAKGQSVQPLDFDESIGLGDAAWMIGDKTAPPAVGSRPWILDTNRSAIEMLPDASRRQHFLNEVNWQHHDFPGNEKEIDKTGKKDTTRSVESVALFNAMERVVPERRANIGPTGIKYHDVDGVVVPVPGNGQSLFPEAKDAFVKMRDAAAADGVSLTILAGHRSLKDEERIRAGNKNASAVAQRLSSHRYGLAIDLAMTVPGLRFNEIKTNSMPNIVSMYRSPNYKWMAVNGRRFGWFPYRPEPWHWEYNPEGFKARFEGSGATGGALMYGAPTGLFESYAPSVSLDDPKSRKGHAIPRGRASDALGKKVLDLLWEEINEDDVPRMRDRLKRFDAELTRLSPSESCALLARLMPGGNLKRDFDYRLSRPSRQRIRRELRGRCESLQIRPPVPVKPTPVPTPIPDPVPPPPVPQKKVPPPPFPVPRTGFNVVAEFEKESEPRRLKTIKYFALYVVWKVKGRASVNATDAALVDIKAKWKNGKFEQELEAQFDSMFIPDVKIESDDKGPLVTFKKGITAGPVQIEPGIQLRFWEPIKVEISMPNLITETMTLAGQRFQIDIGPQVDLLVRIDLTELAKEAAKRGARSLWEGLKDALRRLLGGIFGSAIEEAIVVLVGAVIAKLLLRPDEDEPIEIQPEDVNGWDDALTYANLGRTSPMPDDRFERAATDYRRTYATGFGDTLAELARSTWRARLEDLRNPRQVRSWVRLPRTSMDTDWMAFSLSAGKHGLESVNLYEDDFVARFRISEKAWLFAVAAHARGKLNKDELDEARQTAKQQATVAGMAAAVQHVLRTIQFNTYRFVDEHGKRQAREGWDAWKAVVDIAWQSNLPHNVIQSRLGQLAVDHLPVLKIK